MGLRGSLADLADNERGLLDLTDMIYDAATPQGSWTQVGNALIELFGAGSASIMAGNPAAGERKLLYRGDLPLDAAIAYRDHYWTVDLWTNRAARAISRAADPSRPGVWRSGTLVTDAEFLRSEFYADFGRRLGLRYVVGTVIPIDGTNFMPIGLHRPPTSDHFEVVHVRMLERLVPHLRRAILLGDQLGRESAGRAAAGLAALDALAIGVVVVDGALRVLFANGAAEAMAGRDGPYRFLRRTPFDPAVTLTANHRVDSAALATLARDVAVAGDAGRAIGLRDASGALAVAALVSPLPGRLLEAADAPGGRVPGQALVVLRDIRPPRPKLRAGLLTDLFGLTRAEAEVALALVGGQTKEAVAASRGARVTTVRTQVRAVLAKTGAANLRDLERLLATLA